MELKIATENGRVPVTILQVSGNIDSNSYQDFQSQAEKVIQNGGRHILVDMTHVPYISSAGLRALQVIFNRLRDENKDISEESMRQGISAGTYKSPYLKLLNISKEAELAFKTAGFDMFIETFTDRASAISSF